MATAVIIPKFGMTMEEATIIRWLKYEGDRVEKDEPLLEIMTEKVDMQVEAPASGWLRGIQAEPGQVIPVTRVIAYIVGQGEAAPEKAAAAAGPQQTAASSGEAAAAPETSGMRPMPNPAASVLTDRAPAERVQRNQAPAGEASIAAVPAARRLAKEAGIDLGTVRGTGPGGRITEADVRATIARIRGAGSPPA